VEKTASFSQETRSDPDVLALAREVKETSHMKRNVGSCDAAFRAVLGFALIAGGHYYRACGVWLDWCRC
jgi:hypothetical protein